MGATRSTVHPRVCGELVAAGAPGVDDPGSSPRVRGTREHPCEHPCEHRFIPACAGNSNPPTPSPAVRSVHPRVCGELALEKHKASPEYGSSPRVRGTPPNQLALGRHNRFIPACAGNSRATSAPESRAPVHPRVCGELLLFERSDVDGDGSSPRVRGTRGHKRTHRRHARFIPACAGNSANALNCETSEIGSSPRVRGTRLAMAVLVSHVPVHPRVCGELGGGGGAPLDRRGFIPACAGNSVQTTRLTRIPAVHPRVCGELHQSRPAKNRNTGSSPRVRGTPLCVTMSQNALTGSSPRVRGTRTADRANTAAPPVHPRVCGELNNPMCVPKARLRFIPACAGNSFFLPRSSCMLSVHPRVCGELVQQRVPMHREQRFIPACAGNSTPRSRRPRGPPVHPRVCGELTMPLAATEIGDGSSPRVRGTRCCPRGRPGTCTVHPRVCGELPSKSTPRHAAGRFIPACAGNSFPLGPSAPLSPGSSPRVRGTRPASNPTPSSTPVHPRVCGELP